MAKTKIVCPYCFRIFNNGEAEYQCENNERKSSGEPFCTGDVDERYNNYWGNDVVSNHFFKGRVFPLFGKSPNDGKCDRCGALSNRFVCPHCHNWLPTEMIEYGAEIISIIGAPGSGKTNYFFSLIHELNKYGHRLGLSVIAQNVGPNKTKKTDVISKQVTSLMFDELTIADKTMDSKPFPLIFKITSEKRGRKKGGRTIYLVFYDTPGEAFKDIESMKQMATYIDSSSGVIFLADPYN